MRKKVTVTVLIILIVATTLVITGCTTTTTNPSPVTTTTQENKVNVTATAVQAQQQYNVSTPRPGDKYVVYNVTFTNINQPYTQVSGYFSFALLDTNNNVYNVSQQIQSRYLPNAFPYGYTITQPGDKVSGNLVYEVPQNAQPTTLRYHDTAGYNVTVKL